MSTTNNPFFAKAEMLIRKPVAEVFEAFVNPKITSNFLFTKGSGRLDANKEVTWTWEMYNVSVPVNVKAIVPDKSILVSWGNNEQETSVEWVFTEMKNNTTFVSVTNTGFKGDAEQIVAQIRDSTEGFTLVLAGLKAYLEHHIQLNLVGDRFPKE